MPSRDSSHPPSDPHPALTRPSSAAGFGVDDRPMRVQLAVALVVGVVLVASGLYLWRRPPLPVDPSPAESASAEGPALPAAGGGIVSRAADPAPPPRRPL